MTPPSKELGVDPDAETAAGQPEIAVAAAGSPAASSIRYTDDAEWQQWAGYSRALRRGTLIAVSGTTASALDGAVLFPGDTLAQTEDAIARCLAAVRALGGAASDVTRTRVYLAPDADWRSAAEAHRRTFGDIAPANTMLHVAGLIGEGLLVEVEMEALVLSDSGDAENGR